MCFYNYRLFLILIFKLIFLLQMSYAQSWEVLYNHSGGHLNDIFFVDSFDGWIVGNDGIILHTTDGGYSWDDYDSGTNVQLNTIFFSTAQNGWIVGNAGIILHTADAGTTWVAQESGTSYWLKNVFFLDDSNGWAVGGNTLDGIILRTENGGENWSTIGEGLTGVFLDVYFINNNEGWVVGGVTLFDNFEEEVIWYTTDGGESWEEQVSPTTGPLIKIFFLDADAGWAVGFNEVVIKTGDGGTNWTPVDVKEDTISTNYQFTDLAIPDLNNIWVIDLENIYHSVDGGLNWAVEWDWGGTISPFAYLGMSGVDSIHCWVVGDTTVLGYLGEGNSISETIYEWLPVRASLSHNYPNPFNSTTSINYALSKKEHMSLEVYNILGNKITTIFEGVKAPGESAITLDGSNLATGTYIVHLRTGNSVASCKILPIR